MAFTESARWFEARPAHNRKPATYRCPLCGQQLPALMDHTLLFPEGDHSKRRHAHTACVVRARQSGKLLFRDEWERQQRRRSGGELGIGPDAEHRSWLARLMRALRGGGR